MQIVIEIPEVQYEYLSKIADAGQEPLGYYERVIMRGTPLPEHHGRLIDENDLKTLYGLDDRLWWGNAVAEFTDLPTILEADKESEK